MQRHKFYSIAAAAPALLLTLILLSSASPAHTFNVLYTFTGGDDGGYPRNLTLDSSGNLYGIVTVGGNPWPR
jgi:hypothetical protein